MSTQNDRLQYLVQQYLNDKSTAEELEEFWQQIHQLKDETVMQTELEAFWQRAAAGNNVPAAGWEQVLQQVYVKAKPHMHTKGAIPMWRRRVFRRAAAAVVILMMGVAAYWLINNKTVSTPGVVATTTVQDVPAPQNNRATITLSNGQTVYLDSANNGALASQGDVQVVKLADGQIAYKGAARELLYNTLTNPKGSRVIDMTLSDGSRIWLNAGSSITYPIAFVGNERKVEVKGEIYFEVAHHKAKPFHVTHGSMDVEVLGTHFNVNAYDDEPDVRVTLLEGSVKVANGQLPAGGHGQATGNQQSTKDNERSVVLKRGEQAVIAGSSRFTMHDARPAINHSPDVQQVMAWKNGFFSFTGADLPTVMRQLSRWYNVDVTYEGQIPARKFSGEITHDLTLSQLMNGLQSLGIKFSIQGRTMIVQQK